jgi:hypothetical protein
VPCQPQQRPATSEEFPPGRVIAPAGDRAEEGITLTAEHCDDGALRRRRALATFHPHGQLEGAGGEVCAQAHATGERVDAAGERVDEGIAGDGVECNAF